MTTRAPRNRTLVVEETEKESLLAKTIQLDSVATIEQIMDKIIHQDLMNCIEYIPENCIDLLIVDPPYNLNKKFGKRGFKKKSAEKYAAWFESWLSKILRCLKPNASIYVCSDWKTSGIIEPILARHFKVRNRITWEREKGRGAKKNWKNCSEDVWFCTVSDDYYFNVDAVKLKKRVIAPYRDNAGKPKDWDETEKGNYRLTHPSNLWTDISIPFWSMPENTDHPTQKAEKMIAKLILASTKKGDFILDPFAGSGSTCVVSKKLNRSFCGIEVEEEYCQMAVKRVENAQIGDKIQGIHEGYFWERNSLSQQKSSK